MDVQPLKKSILPKWNPITFLIFAGLFLGLAWGALFPQWVPTIQPFQALFLHGIKCSIAPLIFATIVTGIASAGSFKQLGLMGVRTFVYFEVVTTIALALGLFMVNLLQPGKGVEVDASKLAGSDLTAFAGSMLTYQSFVEHLLPSNFAEAIVRGDVLQIVIFSSLFGFAALAIGEKAKPIISFCEALSEVMFKFVHLIMYLAPLGVCAALAGAVANHGLQVMVSLLKLIGTLYFSLFIFVLVVLLPILKFFKVPIGTFVKAVKDPVIWAFATTASESAYPMTLENLGKMGVPRRIASFVLPMGYSFNLDGSTLYLSLASVFIAQVAGIELSIGRQLLIMLTLMLTSKGVAAVPRASIVVLSGTLAAFGLPVEAIALILGVDAFMDMGRSAINLLGNCVAAAVIARLEGIELGNNRQGCPTDHDPQSGFMGPSGSAGDALNAQSEFNDKSVRMNKKSYKKVDHSLLNRK